jgi:DNA polymerase-3 subunit delta'
MNADTALENFRRVLAAGRTAHAYLVSGPVRGAAGELAVRVLQLLFCEEGGKACDRCDRCRQVRNRTWADAFWVHPEKKSRRIGVDQIRGQLILPVTQTSLAGGWKAGIIAGADRLTPEAANAFLKTLEEPPPQTLLLLLTDAPDTLLPTVVSRCQRVELDAAGGLSEPWRGRLLSLLAAEPPGDPAAAAGAAAALRALLQDLQDAAEAEIAAETRASGELDEDKAVREARVSARYREMRSDVLREMLYWYRDLLVLRAGGDDASVHHEAQRALLRERAQRLTLAQALANADAMDELNRQMERSLPEEALLAYWFDRLAGGARRAA